MSANPRVNKLFLGHNYHDIYLSMLMEIAKYPEHLGCAREKPYQEITNMGFELFNPYNRLVWSPERRANYEFAFKMFVWMLNGSDDADFLTSINKNAENFVDRENPDKPRFPTAYGPRLMENMPAVLAELCRDKESRRATIPIIYPDDKEYLGQNKIEFPCMESITFYIREQKLYCHVNMRSNNMVTTVVYDVYCFTMMQEYVLQNLNSVNAYNGCLEMGTYQHHITSAHYFTDQQPLVDAILSNANNGAFLYRSDAK